MLIGVQFFATLYGRFCAISGMPTGVLGEQAFCAHKNALYTSPCLQNMCHNLILILRLQRNAVVDLALLINRDCNIKLSLETTPLFSLCLAIILTVVRETYGSLHEQYIVQYQAILTVMQNI